MSTPSTQPELTGVDVSETAGARIFVWGFVAQALASAVSFGLTVMAGRRLGPRGLRGVYIGFVSHQLVLGLQRGIVAHPLVVHAAPPASVARRRWVGPG